MREVGAVRRIDELGRVVIPKEIRRAMRLREGETVEVFASGEDEIVLKKRSSMKNMRRSASAYGSLIARKISASVIITDREEIIDGAGVYVGKKLSDDMIKCLEKREPHSVETSLIRGGAEEKLFVVPVIVGGDAVGGIIIKPRADLDECDRRILEIVGECMAIGLE